MHTHAFNNKQNIYYYFVMVYYYLFYCCNISMRVFLYWLIIGSFIVTWLELIWFSCGFISLIFFWSDIVFSSVRFYLTNRIVMTKAGKLLLSLILDENWRAYFSYANWVRSKWNNWNCWWINCSHSPKSERFSFEFRFLRWVGLFVRFNHHHSYFHIRR